MSYDQGYWHSGTCAEMRLPEENAATHIAAYLKWCIYRYFMSESIETEDAKILDEIRSGRKSAAKYFENSLDWKFGEWCLNEAENKFTSAYYERYLDDLEKYFPGVVYGAERDVDFESLCTFLNERLSEYMNGAESKLPLKNEPCWKLW